MIRIADDAKVLVTQRHRVSQHVLGVIGVLIFVDQDVLESLLQFLEHFGVIAKRVSRAKEKIVEIQCVVLVETLLILGEDPRDGLR